MKLASLLTSVVTMRSIYITAISLLFTATTHAQLMRKDTATMPTNAKHWEVGLDLKPLWEKDEPYNFVVRYFFKEKWALRGGVGFEMDWSSDTLNIDESLLTVGTPTFIYGLYKGQKSKNLTIQAFMGIQYERSRGKLRWYNAIDFFFFKYKTHYNAPSGIYARATDSIVTPDFVRIDFQENIQTAGGIRLINGFAYRIAPNLSFSTEIAVSAQGLKYRNEIDFSDYSVYNNEIIKNTRERGWKYNIKVEPLFRVFINYHF